MSELIKAQRDTILIVDDTPDNLTLINGILKDIYHTKLANSGEKGLKIAESTTPPDLILLDILMPDMDGYEVCRRLKTNPATAHIPVIFLTAKNDIENETHGLELGAVDYLTKPINGAIVKSRVKTHLSILNQHRYLEAEVKKRTAEIEAIQDVTILAMASLAETRDNETGNHILRTQHYVKLLSEKLRFHPRFAHFLDDDKILDMIFKSAPLHDIGKVGIPDKILLKPGKFEPDEFEIMKTHAAIGKATILKAERLLGIEVPFLIYAKEIAYSHHEKWDGTGYPDGLAGEDIPITARLMAIADVYDALISRRVYKDGMAHEKAEQIIVEGKGKHFDPDMVDAFLEIQDDFRIVACMFTDNSHN